MFALLLHQNANVMVQSGAEMRNFAQNGACFEDFFPRTKGNAMAGRYKPGFETRSRVSGRPAVVAFGRKVEMSKTKPERAAFRHFSTGKAAIKSADFQAPPEMITAIVVSAARRR